MLRIVIAMASDDLGHALESQLSTDHSIVRCFDGNTALALLQHLRPDVLITDLSLPYLDGLSLLRAAKDSLPSLVVGITDFDNPDVRIQAKEAGFTSLYRLPMDIGYFQRQLCNMLQNVVPADSTDEQMRKKVAELLHQFGFKTNLSGYQQLIIGIPMVIKDVSIPVCKELYPQISALTGGHGSGSVEHTIRTSIKDAWENGDRSFWERHFPTLVGSKMRCPSNKLFMTTVANLIAMD